MEILIPTIGSAGDVIPLITLGAVLSKRGHRVTILANEVFREQIQQSGLHYLQLGDQASYERVTLNPDLWHPQKAFSLIAAEFVLPSIRPLVSIIRQFDPRQVLILASGFCFGARLAQEKWGYPTLSLHLQPAVLQSAYQPPRIGNLAFPDWFPVPLTRFTLQALDRWFTDPILAPEVNRIRSELDLQPVDRIFSHWMHSLLGVIGMFPDWFAPPQPDWPENTELTGFIGDLQSKTELPQELSDFLESGEMPIFFTLGTSMYFANTFFEESVKVCQRLGCRGIFLTRDQSQIPDDLPGSILFVNYAPFQTLMPRCQAVVYHGGIGTLSQAMKAGIPQLVVPFSHDQPDNAERIRQLGAGDWIWPHQYKGKSAATKLEALIESRRVAEVTGMLADWIDFDQSRMAACRLIEMHLSS